jgi:hypothetical protein
MANQSQRALSWQASSGPVECYEGRIVTNWSEYIRGVVISQERRAEANGYTAYVEYFTYGVPRQVWGARIFPNADQAKTWCEDELARIQSR